MGEDETAHASLTRYHCYTEYHEGVYQSDVEAASPLDAAAKAAEEHRIPGLWTVIPGEPVEVNVVQHTTYEAAPAAAEETQ